MALAHESSGASWSSVARGVLGAVVLIQALGLVLSTAKEGTPIGTWLFLDRQWPELAAKQLEWVGTWLACGASVVLVLATRPLVRAIGGGWVALWCLLLALAQWNNGGTPFYQLSVLAHAGRIGAPLILALWDRPRIAGWLLRGSIALTFATHGWEALHLHPVFTDYLLAADRNVFGLGLRQEGAETILRIIGLHDFLLAAFVVAGGKNRWVLGWMVFWGVLTAMSRVVHMGHSAAYLAIVRASNGGLPLVLLLVTRRPSMSRRSILRLARAALPLALFLLPLAAGAQALEGGGPAHLRVVWTEDPAHHATISWSTESAGSTHEVHIDTEPRGGEIGSYARTVQAGSNGQYSTGGGYYHHADIDGLVPGTTYYFVVVSDGQVSDEYHFVTAHDDDRPFRLLYGGDSRRPGEEDRRTMNQLIARLVEEDPGIVALAHGGDYIQSEDSWEEWDDWMADHALTFTSDNRILPIIPVRGNHEGDGVMFNEVFGFPGGPEVDYYVTELGPNVRLITLDTNVSIGGNQTEWLEQQLQAAQTSRWIIPSYHRPAYPAVKEPSGAREFWVPLFEQYDADVVLENDGHVLKRTVPIRNEEYDPSGVVYIGEGGLGVPQRKPVEEWYLEPPGMATGAHHVQRFSISPEQMVYEAILMDGSIGDTWTFQPRREGTAAQPGPAEPTPGEPGAGEEEPEGPGAPTGEPAGEPSDGAPGFAPVAIDGVNARSRTEVAVTFSTDMDPATTANPTSYQLLPRGEVVGVEMESERTAVITTTELVEGTEYELVVRGVTSAGGERIDTARITFSAPSSRPDQPIEPAAQGYGGEGCAAAGGSLAVAGLAVVATALGRRRERRAA